MATKKPGRKPMKRLKVENYLAKHPGVTATEAAKKCGCSVGYVYAVKNGKSGPGLAPPQVPVIEWEPSLFARVKQFLVLLWRGK